MTEAGVLTMSLGFAKHPFATKRGSCGTVVRNAEIKIVDPVSGDSLPRNEAGEICIRGPQLMKGSFRLTLSHLSFFLVSSMSQKFCPIALKDKKENRSSNPPRKLEPREVPCP